ncbi:hypothetical protein FD44_GL000118 [Secundilactobacillus malefermentans DSM 5705 = KCTC 3548]|nr:TetR/AcrR family transcriptional regulator [Secundilactobacillus malefermentans]KRM59110.1 hypothetical protein FD44_GL000118 [Secundilactobacillus malefermentans DSM 5705 = KCTC 3548]
MASIPLSNPMAIDARSKKSQQKLYQALRHYYGRNIDFNKITVKASCEQANVSRATFYRHHQDLRDILTVQFIIVISELEARVDQLTFLDFETGSQELVNIIDANFDLIRLMNWSQSRPRIEPVISGAALRILILRDYPEPNRTFVATFLGATILQFAQQVVQAPEPLSKAAILKLYRKLIPDL